jgi:serine/threonine protein kinase/tetratricopeptide (TPR) repeat protein
VSAEWERLKDLFAAALDHPPEERSVFVHQACDGDQSLENELNSLLAAHNADSSSLARVAGSVARVAAGLPVHETPAVELGRRIGPYKLIRQIGHGGMAAVYLAVRADEVYRKQVAIKIVSAGLENAELLRRFRNERQTLAALDHPNIVKLLDAGSTEDGLPYLVMDYVEGKPIDEYCDSRRLSTAARLELFRTVCSAVEYAHQNGVIHRDIKPANVLVAEDGSPRLLDFGIAKLLDSDRLAVTGVLTRSDVRPMTPGYASPEQVRGGDITPATDIYSLGVLLYKLLTGHAPYRLKSHTPMEMERMICDTDPQKPSIAVNTVEEVATPVETKPITPEAVSQIRESEPKQLSRTLRGDLDSIVLKSLRKEPARRYLSVRDFSDDITRYLEGYAVTARQGAFQYRVGKFVRRRRGEIALAALVVLLIAAGIIGTFEIQKRRNEAANAALRAGALLPPGRRSVAVLGFRNLSQRPQTEWMATALSEMLSTELASGEKLRVIPGDNVARVKMELGSNNSDAFSGNNLAAIRKNLSADYVVVGSYLVLGGESAGNLRLDLQLKDTAGGSIVSALSDHGSEAELDDLVMRVGAQLRQKLGVGEVQRAAVPAIKAALPSSPEARALYAEGLTKLRLKEALAAKNLLEKAVAAEPGFPLSHSELSQAWKALGYDAKAAQEAERAFQLSGTLSREQKLLVEARYREANTDWPKAIEIYRTLFDFFPDNLEYGLALAQTQINSGNTKDALTTLAGLHKLAPPQGDDPGIAILEAVAYEHTGDYKRQLAISQQAAAIARSRGAKLLLARALYSQAGALGYQGQAQQGTSLIAEGQQIYADAGDRGAVARGYSTTGAILWKSGDFSAAMKMYEKALAINREIGDKGTTALTLNNIALAMSQLGNPVASEKAMRESLAIFHEIGNQFGEATALVNLAGFLYDRGDLSEAGKMYESSLALAQKVGDSAGAGTAQVNIAQIKVQLGELGAAQKIYNQALDAFRSSDDKSDSAYPIVGLGEIAMLKGDLAGARKLYEQGLTLRAQLGEKGTTAETQMALAELAVEEGKLSDAESLARVCTGEFQKEGDTDNEILSHAVLARVLQEQERLGDARAEIAKATSLLPKTQKFIAQARTLLISSRISIAEGNLAAARNGLTRLEADARKHNSVPIQLSAQLAAAQLELKSGSTRQAQIDLSALQKGAQAKGFGLIARKASALSRQI